MISLYSIKAENLRGYQTTELIINKLSILVGENNEGKSSILKMLEKFLAIPDIFWTGDAVVSEEDYEFWYPANNAKHQARRFTVVVKIEDGRTSRQFGTEKNANIQLRFAISSNGSCRLNIGKPQKNEKHDKKAEKLLKLIKENLNFILLPPVRDSKSSAFNQKITHSVKTSLAKVMNHSRRAGAPKEYRLALAAIEQIAQIVELNTGEIKRSNDSPLASMLRSSEVRVELFPKDILDLIEKSMYVYLSTGEHDELKVLPNEVGNGLQSLIDINQTIESILVGDQNKKIVIVIEEPEAFLHPSAQRQFMQFLRRALVQKVHSAIITTHSPVIVDESEFQDLVIVRGQKHFSAAYDDKTRTSINTSLISMASSELFFARTIVFVEGEGDKALLNNLLKRIRANR